VGELDAELTEAIARAVENRRGESVWLLQKLVHVPSVTGEEGAVQQIASAGDTAVHRMPQPPFFGQVAAGSPETVVRRGHVR
jgi:hypothetical protein